MPRLQSASELHRYEEATTEISVPSWCANPHLSYRGIPHLSDLGVVLEKANN